MEIEATVAAKLCKVSYQRVCIRHEKVRVITLSFLGQTHVLVNALAQ